MDGGFDASRFSSDLSRGRLNIVLFVMLSPPTWILVSLLGVAYKMDYLTNGFYLPAPPTIG